MKKVRVGSTPVATAIQGDGYTMLFKKLKTYGPWFSEGGEEYPYPELGANFIEDGELLRWGDTQPEDPDFCPYGPEIADIEISAGQCDGVRTHDGKFQGCTFCSPAGTKVQTPEGDVDIKTLKSGDLVLGHSDKEGNQVQTILETYQREYSGEMIIISLENEKELRLTPNHKVQLTNGRWVKAGDLTIEDEIREI